MTYNIEVGILAFMIAFLLILMFHPYARADAHTRDYRCSLYEVEKARLARGGKPRYTAEQVAEYTSLYNQYCRR